MLKPFCSTCGKDVAEVLCPTCAKWWADNPPPADLVDAAVFALARKGCITGLPISDAAKEALLTALAPHMKAIKDAALDEVAEVVSCKQCLHAILALKEQP